MLPSKCEYMYHKNEEFKIDVSGLMMRMKQIKIEAMWRENWSKMG